MPLDEHVAYTYRDPAALRTAVASWLAPPLRRGGGALLACRPEHVKLAREELQELGVDPDQAEREGRLVALDADALLARFMVKGTPDAQAFRNVARAALRDLRARVGDGPIRTWGEMVDILVKRGEVDAADGLERLWNETIREQRVQLLCTYQLDVLDPARHAAVLLDVCETHTALVPQDGRALDPHVPHAIRDVFGSAEPAALRQIEAARERFMERMSPGAATLASLRALHPALGEEVAKRARERRERGVSGPHRGS